ncbi:helix-turn-helix transcriptional regulator [Actinokineospora sp. G85]|uniref:helix-turn-helix transcriptional regulator n=1 Tax=Actinokineospora sp. G85 TaxID=3406626 RepID=UPI003C724197
MRFAQDFFTGFGDDPAPGLCETAGFLRRSTSSWYSGRLDLGLQYAAAATARPCHEPHEFCHLAQLWYVKLLTMARELEAGALVLDGIDARGGDQSQRMSALSHAARGELLFAMGNVDDAIAETDVGLRLAERCGVRSMRPPSYVVMALGALRRADMRACLHFVEKLADEALLGYGHAAGAWVTAHAMEARSGVTTAAGLVAGIVTDPVVLRQLLVSEPAAASWLVRASLKLGERELAKTSVAAAADASVKHPHFSVIRASALHAAGLLDADADTLHEAANLYPDRWCAASAREDMADLMAKRLVERDRAIRLFEAVLGTYNAVGATRDVSRVVNKLRELGVRRGVSRSVEREGCHGLTDAEFAVADLVSQGYTNSEVGRQLFISQHTVAFHLKKVFQKMSVASRVELAAGWKVPA